MPDPIPVASRRSSRESLQAAYPGAVLIDVTSRGPEPWVRFSPFFPHGGIPIPGAQAEETAASVEGLWQGLKEFEREGIDPRAWTVTSMKGIKRGAGVSRGAVLGHRGGIGPDAPLLDYEAARRAIYLPAYRWVLTNRLAAELDQLRRLAEAGPVVLLDYETNSDVADLQRPLSHAGLLSLFLSDRWPG